MSTLYLSGFEDFTAPKSTGLIPNPSRLLIEYIERIPGTKEALAKLGGFDEVITLLKRVPVGEDFETLRTLSKHTALQVLSLMENSDAIISLGQGSYTQKGPLIESRFVNKLTWDQLGAGLIDPNKLPNHTLGQGDYLNNLVQQLQKTHPQTKKGVDAGEFVCNLWGYLAQSAAPERSIFVHLPGSPNEEIARKLWRANELFFRGKGLSSHLDMGYPTVEDNFAFLKTLVSVWRPFETRSI